MTPEQHLSRRDFLKGVLATAGAGVLASYGIRGNGLLSSVVQAEAPKSTPLPTKTKIPDRFPTVQTRQKAQTETAASPEQEKGVDFSTIDTAMSGNTLVALVRPEGDDGSAYVASLNLDKIDLSSGTLLIEAKHKVPFVVQQIGGAIAISPTDPNHILVFGYTVPFFGKEQGASLDIDRQKAVFVQGEQGALFGGQFKPDGQWALIPQVNIVNPDISSWAKFSVAEQRIVANLTNDGVSAQNLTPFFAGSVPDNYKGYGARGSGPGYVAINVNGDTITTEVKGQEGGWGLGRLLFFPDGTDSMVGLFNIDDAYPDNPRGVTGILFINRNDILQYRVRPGVASISAALFLTLPASIIMLSADFDPIKRQLIVAGHVIGDTASQGAWKTYIEIMPFDDPSNLDKRQLVIPTAVAGAKPITGEIRTIFNRYINNRQYIIIAGLDFGMAIADVTDRVTGKTNLIEFKQVKLKLQPRMFLPLTARP